MFVVRLRWKHFIHWILFAPLLLIEAKVVGEFLGKLALRDPERSRHCMGEVTEYQDGNKKDHILIRYHFQIPGDTQWYTASDMTGRRDLWITITPAAWEEALQNNKKISIRYLPNDPWVNEPDGIAGTPVLDSLCGWGMVLGFDLYWLFELYLVVKQYLICRAAADERRGCSLRFWETREE
jgi:hypothetical protein